MAQIGTSSVEFSLKLLLYISDFMDAANKVLVLKEQFQSFAKMVDRLKPVLHELKDNNAQNFSEPIKGALSNLQDAISKALVLSHSCGSGSVCLLLLKSPDILKKIDTLSKEISFCLDAFNLSNLQFSSDTSARVVELRDTMQHTEFKAAVETEAIITKLQGVCQNELINSQSAIQMLLEIAKVTGAQVGSSFVAREIEAVKKQKVELEEQKQRNEAHILEQVIAFLDSSDRASRRSTESLKRYNHLPTEEVPLKAFCCRLTGKVMEDPVDISSGHTFERKAIEEWFDGGNNTCPASWLLLTNYEMHPNVSLVESIKEWKGKIATSRLEKAVKMLLRVDRSEMDGYLSELVELIPKARANFHIIPQLMSLLCLDVDISVKRKVMSCLASLAVMSFKHKELIVEEYGVSLALKCLVDDDDIGIRAQGLTLLLELSREHQLCERIGKAKDCIPLLVASANGGDAPVANMARDTLSNLSVVMENLVLICEANYFMPLLCMLENGSLQDKVKMAVLLGKTSLTDYSRTSLVQQNILPLLVQLLSEASPIATPAILGAIQNLVSQSDRAAAVETEVVQPLLKILLSREAAKDSVCHEIASGILASLVMPISKNVKAEPDSLGSANLIIFQEKETIRGLIVLLATADASSSSKVHLLRILLAAATLSNGGSKAQEEMLDAGAVQLLLTFCDERETAVRLYTFRLMNILLENDNGQRLVDILEEKHVKDFVTALSDLDLELVMAVLGILSRFPVQDFWVMGLLVQTEALPKVMELLSREDFRPLRESDRLIESALGVFLLFVNTPFPAILERLIQFEPMALLVRILDTGRPLARQRAAVALARLSENTMRLSRPAAKSKKIKFLCCCFGGQATIHACSVHDKICSAKKSFCLLEAKAIIPLLKALGEKECCVDEAALGALETLLGGDKWEQGLKAIKDARGLTPILRILTAGSRQAQEKVLVLLVKLTSEKEYSFLIGQAEECKLIQLMQKGSFPVRKLAARILGNVGKITVQSSYF